MMGRIFQVIISFQTCKAILCATHTVTFDSRIFLEKRKKRRIYMCHKGIEITAVNFIFVTDNVVLLASTKTNLQPAFLQRASHHLASGLFPWKLQ